MTIDKGLGFIRNIRVEWLDAAAESRLHTNDVLVMRGDLDRVLRHDMQGAESRRKTVDVLVGIWSRSESLDKNLFDQALRFLLRLPPVERIWLHYGLTVLYYPFFRQTAAVIGQFARTGEPVTRPVVKHRLAAEIGHLGSLNRAAERVMASLGDWGALLHESKGNVYTPQLQVFKTKDKDLQSWLLACALSANPAEQLPFSDLVRIPELYPFQFSVTLDALRKRAEFYVQRQGMWDMVRLGEGMGLRQP